MSSSPSGSDALVPSGVIPPVCTPLTPERDLDVASLERLCALFLDAGVAALFVGGSTGEAAYLTDEMRARVLSAVVGFAGGQVPVFAGVIDMTTARVVQQARAAEKAGADGLVATAPFYAPTHPAEIAVHFRTLRAAVDLPLLAYDIPSAVHVKLPADLVAELAGDRTLAGLKDSSGDINAFREVRQLVADPSFKAFTGSEVVADLALLVGGDGIVPGLGNVDPAGFVRLYDAARRNDWPAAVAEQERLRRLFAMIRVGDQRRMGFYSSAVGAFKAALVHRGILTHPTT
ncbi:MAG TPA: dihydrodipicolinate synthase family protein, partial [Actinopolymorphaceae bacterium]|nr:dihydrodipicolinate synthase family protein [Actinopolymorphaceae bacterium]